MGTRPQSQAARILRALSDGRWHSSAAIHRKVGTTRLNSRISELRKRGYEIEHERVKGRGPFGHRYRLATPLPRAELSRLFAPAARSQDALDRSEVPRDDAHRYRIYRMVLDELELVGTAKTPSGVGQELVELGNRGVFERSCVGLLDTRGTDEEPGTWLILPWDQVY